MTDTDKAVELARTFCDECVGGEGCTCDMCIIARAVLAMAPVVVAARAWDNQTGGNALRDAEYALSAAVAALDAETRRVWQTEGKAPAGICPYCGSTVSVVQRDEWYVARCSHPGCGASGPQHRSLTRAVDWFCRHGKAAPGAGT